MCKDYLFPSPLKMTVFLRIFLAVMLNRLDWFSKNFDSVDIFTSKCFRTLFNLTFLIPLNFRSSNLKL